MKRYPPTICANCGQPYVTAVVLDDTTGRFGPIRLDKAGSGAFSIDPDVTISLDGTHPLPVATYHPELSGTLPYAPHPSACALVEIGAK